MDNTSQIDMLYKYFFKSPLTIFCAIFFSFGVMTAGTANGATIDLPVFNNASIIQTAYVQFAGIPILAEDSTNTTSDFKVTLDEAGMTELDAQFEVISRYDEDNDGAEVTDKIRTVMVVFKATVPAQSSTTYYLQVNPGSGTGGDVSGSNIAFDEAGYHQISTGNLTAEVAESAGFNIFDRVTVDGVDVISNPSSDGIVLVSGGTTYTSYNTNDLPELEIIYNGPLFCLIKASGHVEDNNNNPLIPAGTPPTAVNPVSFVVYYWAYKDERTVHTGFRLKNENQGFAGMSGTTNRNTTITSLALKTSLSGLGTITEADFDDWSDLTSPSGDYWIEQDHCLPGACAQASEANTESTPNFNYYIKEGATTRHTGRRFDSYAQIRDADRGLMISQEYHWQNWPNDINFDATNKEAIVYLLPDEAEDHIFLAASWKYWHLAYNFHADVADSYDFSAELAAAKNPLKVLLGNQIAISGFYADRTPPDFTFTATGGGGESIGGVAADWKDSILATSDSSHSDSGYFNKDFTDIREQRNVSDTTGVYDGPVDMYGWLRFGDFVRGAGAGAGGLNYGWNYLEVLNGHKYQRYEMLRLGEQMSVKTADQLVIHSPVNDTTILNSSGSDAKTLHGGHAGENDADTSMRNYLTGSQEYDHRNWMHGFPHGLILEYGLTGKPWLNDALTDMGDFLRYNYSRLPLSHSAFPAQTNTAFDAVSGTASYHIFLEVRAYVRSMGMAVGLYQMTGNKDYYDIAKGIFNNVLIPSEYPVGSGYLRTFDNYPNYAPWYTIQSFKFNLMLRNAALEVGDATLANDISSFMLRSANWFKRISEEDLAATAGTYLGGNYFPHTTFQYWTEDGGYSGVAHPEYTIELADLYAFAYEQTGLESWLNLARDNFKDPWYYTDPNIYGPVANTWRPVNMTSMGSIGLIDGSQQASWLKAGKNLVSPMYYMNIEYGVTLNRSDVDNSSATNTTDALLTLRNSLGLSMDGTAWQVGAMTGDVNCSGTSNSTDALLILRYSLGLSMEETSWCE
ncbi:MAG: hypothetical protein UR66_C0015G0016 [Candidatus Moranbacteria bacterium GW2011_GWE1_35_17]|nr:MAG: hypothetical protein UR66_C0015G0016 [Candidatus Moranbacteria bacterium GW2011_GWE1_35_17]KKP82578.1 MAG: hypothetical protein UR83_C0050G0004 [Candidatus Moranbacteria bacterium GW2011_GWF2_35_54]KKP83011.1 MAG: hypothetical protein UR82_C0026G0011 [Candidatus Moranbacteria bacterium GW2011_GWF1_35_5]